MKTQAFVISISLFFCAEACAVRVVTCDKPDSDYIAAKFSSGAFVQANKIEKNFPSGSLKHSEICEVRNELIMDGLAFTLYKPESDKKKYISVYNGLDGSSQLYGPFN